MQLEEGKLHLFQFMWNEYWWDSDEERILYNNIGPLIEPETAKEVDICSFAVEL